MTENSKNGFFFSLTPDHVLAAVEQSGLRCTGRCFTLNSFENRVYDVEIELPEDESPIEGSTPVAKNSPLRRRIVKFYRPGRWTYEQILEEHEFLLDLNRAEIPAIAPLPFPDGKTLHSVLSTSPSSTDSSGADSGIWYALFPKVGGRAPDELTDDQLLRIGRLMGRIHNVGATKNSAHRLAINPDTYGRSHLKFLLEGKWIPLEFERTYSELVEKICALSDPLFQGVSLQRIHGDCHLGNLLWNDSGPFFLDFDDMVIGPSVQDIWLVVPGRDQDALRQREILLEGYREFRDFKNSDLRLVEALRALRFVHYATWIAKRWNDPAFPLAFPQFGTHHYWSGQVDDLTEQLALLR